MNGKTRYEQYYVDMLSFWRELYDPDPEAIYLKITDPNNFSGDIYVNAFKELNDINNKNLERKYIYCIHKGELQRYIDTIDMSNQIDNLYYLHKNEYVKIIDSVNFNNKTVYIKTGEGVYQHIYKTLPLEDKELIYITHSANSKNYKKMIDYFSLNNYADIGINQTKIDNHFYIKKDDDKIVAVEQIFLDDTCIWLYNHSLPSLTQDVIKLILEAAKSKIQFLKFITEDGFAPEQYKNSYEFLFKAERMYEHTDYMYYKTGPGALDYLLIQDKYLNYETDINNKYSKYNIYFKENETFVSSIDIINIDKATIYFKEEDKYQLYLDKISNLPIGLKLYIKTEEKKKITDIDNDLIQFYKKDMIYKNGFEQHKLDIKGNFSVLNTDIIKTNIYYYEQTFAFYKNENNIGYWNKEIYKDFNKSKFWLDFLTGNYPVRKYKVKNIGQRIKTINNDLNTGISFNEHLKVIYYKNDQNIKINNNSEYSYIEINDNILSLFACSSQTLSCHDLLNEEFAKTQTIGSNISLTSIPIYHLDVGNIIQLVTADKHLYGNYEILRLTIPISFNGMMQLQCEKYGEEVT